MFEGETVTRWRIGAVALDCDDHRRLGRFYSELLDTEIVHEADTFCALRVDGTWLLLKEIAGYSSPTWPDTTIPQQEHLDFAVDDLDVAEEIAIAAGARRAEHQPAPESWRVMLDPAGHPFCLNGQIPD
jgi:hypothetical protein